MGALFELGCVVATPAVLELLGELEVSPSELLERHASGDWGTVPQEDAHENERSLKHGFRLLSSYLVGEGRVWIITEADRSATAILLPEDY